MATRTNLVIDQGTTFQHVLYITDAAGNPFNLNGFTAASQIKRTYSSLTSRNFTCTINAVAGTITLGLSPVQSANIVSGQYVYDVALVDASNNVTRAIEGIATVTPGVTNITIETTSVTYSGNTDFTVVPLAG